MRRFLSGYRVFWLAFLALLAGSLYYGLFIRESADILPPIDIAQVQMEEPGGQTSKPGENLDEQAQDLRVDLEEAEITLSSGDGKLKMRIWADKGERDGQNYSITEGALQFALESRDTLILKVSDATYRRSESLALVEGELTGYIVGSQQYFSASSIIWDPRGKSVSATRVTYSSPHLEVTGDEMSMNLETGEVRFAGPVEAGI